MTHGRQQCPYASVTGLDGSICRVNEMVTCPCRVTHFNYIIRNEIYLHLCNQCLGTLPAFLSLLDYVSRAHEIEIRPSSVRPSVRRPSVTSITTEVTAWIAFKFQLWLPLVHMSSFHFFFLFFRIFFFVFVNMGPYGSQNFKTLILPQISFESFQTVYIDCTLWDSYRVT